jgi:hypothetical protein
MSDKKTGLARLRQPFDPHQINLLPKQVRKDDRNKMKCEPANGRNVAIDGKYCGGYHAQSVHLDFVGHAALTDRLLEVDPEWSWEPLAIADNGLPQFDANGGLWIKLSICGITRLGYGDAPGKSGGLAVKEAIGDALRNAGMRFGAALDLWHKGDLHDASEEQGKLEETPAPPAPTRTVQRKKVDIDTWTDKAADCANDQELYKLWESAKAAGEPDSVLALISSYKGKVGATA